MAINLATKYSGKVDERFKLGALTGSAVNSDYDWIGVNTVKVYSIPTVAMGDYTRSGSARYGTPSELADTVQEMSVSEDRAFTFTIDKGNELEQMGAKEAGKALRRQIDEIVLPEIDEYRITEMVSKNGKSASVAISASTAYSSFLTAMAALDDKKVPRAGRFAFVSPTYYGFIKQDDGFIKASDLGQKMVINGQVGELDGAKIIMVPSSYLPTGAAFVLAHKSATVGVQKLKDYILHKNPPGINGTLVEGRVIYDAFVLDNKIDAIYTHYTSGTICAAPTVTYVGASTDTITLASSTGGTTIKYTLDGTDPRDSSTAETYSSALDTSEWDAGSYTVRCYAYDGTNIDSIVTTSVVAVSAT